MDTLYPEVRRDINHIQIILPDKNPEESNYQYEMLTHNQITGLLPIMKQFKNGLGVYSYDISNKQSLSSVYENRELEYNEIRSIMIALSLLVDRMKEFLLDENCLLLSPDYIYMDIDKKNVWFLFYPCASQYFKYMDEFRKMSEFLISCVNHKDDLAVELVYGIFKETRSENFTLQTVINHITMFDQQNQKSMEDEAGYNEITVSDVQDTDRKMKETNTVAEHTIQTVNEEKVILLEDTIMQIRKTKKAATFASIVGAAGMVLLLLYIIFYLKGEITVMEYIIGIMLICIPGLVWMQVIELNKYHKKAVVDTKPQHEKVN